MSSDSSAVRRVGIGVICLFAGLALLPFSYFLRTPHEVRVMPHVNPIGDIAQSEDTFVKVPVFFAPIREIDALGPLLCSPMTVHAQLAMLVSRSFGTSARNACGQWPQLSIAGTPGTHHVAAIDADVAAQVGVSTQGGKSALVWNDEVRPVAPSTSLPLPSLQRMQVIAAPNRGQATHLHYAFTARGSDLLAITNLYTTVAAVTMGAVKADEKTAKHAYADAGFNIYSCEDCSRDAMVRWDVSLDAIEENTDIVVLSPPVRNN